MIKKIKIDVNKKNERVIERKGYRKREHQPRTQKRIRGYSVYGFFYFFILRKTFGARLEIS